MNPKVKPTIQYVVFEDIMVQFEQLYDGSGNDHKVSPNPSPRARFNRIMSATAASLWIIRTAGISDSRASFSRSYCCTLTNFGNPKVMVLVEHQCTVFWVCWSDSMGKKSTPKKKRKVPKKHHVRVKVTPTKTDSKVKTITILHALRVESTPNIPSPELLQARIQVRINFSHFKDFDCFCWVRDALSNGWHATVWYRKEAEEEPTLGIQILQARSEQACELLRCPKIRGFSNSFDAGKHESSGSMWRKAAAKCHCASCKIGYWHMDNFTWF